MAAKPPPPPDEGAVFREVATRKLEAERIRVQQLAAENAQLREMAADLQKKISIANARAAELERKIKLSANEAQRDAEEELARLKDRFDRQIADLKEQHQRELQRVAAKGERVAQKLEGVQDSAQSKLADLQDQLNQERQARTEAEARLRAIEAGVRRVASRAGQVTGFEADTPEELIQVLSGLDPERPLKVLRTAMRELHTAAGNVERAFAKAVKDDTGKAELHEAARAFGEARALPDIEDLPPAPAQLVEEAFKVVEEEVAERIKGSHYSALIAAMAAELVRLLRNDREQMDKLARLVDIAEGTELATAARLLLKGATSHQQEIAAARLVAEELRQVKAEAREQKGKVKKLYAVAETGMAGEWAVAAIQAMAALKPLPPPDPEAARRPVYHHVLECGKLVQERIDSAMNLGASAEAALREADEAFSGLEGLLGGVGELVAAARRELLSKIEGESDVRLKLGAARTALAALGKRGQKAAALFDAMLKHSDLLLNQWKATYKLYAALARDLNRLEASIDGQMLDLNQPLESEEGRRLYQIIHDLSEHLPEFRALAIIRQRLFVHLENPKQRLMELKHVREAAQRIFRALGEPDPRELQRFYQYALARLYDIWAALEEVRGGTHSQLAVCAEQIEPYYEDVLTWLSSADIALLTEGEQRDLMCTAAYVRRLKKLILGFHDRARSSRNATGPLTTNFEQRLDTLLFEPDWDAPLARLDTQPAEEEPSPPTERERR
ncbi:MAG: hypothetical protein HS108_11390 [Planctomycetes bacterium]|jgi:hypothetical protein|nr:hypothetical protein [Planctomycetota bacterium]MCL4731479.1 hypothetical protein [Planctomycetota bacterium]